MQGDDLTWSEYCNLAETREQVIYAWHGDTWCLSCAKERASCGTYELVGDFDSAPVGRPLKGVVQ